MIAPLRRSAHAAVHERTCAGSTASQMDERGPLSVHAARLQFTALQQTCITVRSHWGARVSRASAIGFWKCRSPTDECSPCVYLLGHLRLLTQNVRRSEDTIAFNLAYSKRADARRGVAVGTLRRSRSVTGFYRHGNALTTARPSHSIDIKSSLASSNCRFPLAVACACADCV